jgi:hypothetical protein
MSVDKAISLAVIKKQIADCATLADDYQWKFSDIDEENQKFIVSMPDLNGSLYHAEVIFNDFPEIPLLIDFIDPETGEKGTKKQYPLGKGDSFFHAALPCICNPSSRKSYKECNPGPPHGDWTMIGWQNNAKVGDLKTLDKILLAIFFRINNPEKYEGSRMAQ